MMNGMYEQKVLKLAATEEKAVKAHVKEVSG